MANFGTSKKSLKDFFTHLNTDESRHLYNMLDDPRGFIVGKKIKDAYLVISFAQDKDRVLNKQRWEIPL
ncbi:hypothetical protein [Holospora elegans]|uniref:hypothetical protein n=1 Tax=Holospora elegans TaxID=431043 RepID=UPI0019D3C57D|nr:hypothetical protein [Holospora elegans]